MRTCCGCLDTAKGTVLTAVACIAACATTFAFIVTGLFYWESVSYMLHEHYNSTGIPEDIADVSVLILWWGNIFTLIFMIIYVILCVLMVMGVKKEQYKHMIPWISLTTMLIPFVIISFIIQLVFGIIGGSRMGILIPVFLVLIWCIIWTYGYFCSVSHYRMLKGDIHRPVTTLFKRDNSR